MGTGSSSDSHNSAPEGVSEDAMSRVSRQSDNCSQTVRSRSCDSPRNRVTNQSRLAQSRPDHAESRASAIKTSRTILCLSFLVLAAVFGVSVFFIFSTLENKLALEQFQSIAARATSYARRTTQSKRLGVMTMAEIIGNVHPNATNWPFVLVDGYDTFARRLVQTISGDGISFAPIIFPDQLKEFEKFAYDSYNNKLNYTNTTGVSSFGRGVWAKDDFHDVEAEDQKYHEGIVHPKGETTYGSPYEIYTPILQHSDGPNAEGLMLNLHNERKRGETIDSIISCAASQNNIDDNESEEKISECGQMTDVVLLTQEEKPAVLVMQPIFPSLDPSTMTGIVSSPLVWGDVLHDAFGVNINGIYCVLTSTTGKSSTNITYTYYVMNGNVVLLDEGNNHDTKFSRSEQVVALTDKESGLYSEFSPSFTLRLYPSEAFMKTYHTKKSIMGGVHLNLYHYIYYGGVFCIR